MVAVPTSRSASRAATNRLLRVLAGEPQSPPPVWLMRQAGRYLPEYKATRKEAGSFLDLCYNPALAAEVTLQPIRRYGFDAAILFSDILVVPDALGQGVRFVEGEGPELDPIGGTDGLKVLDVGKADKKFSIICETVARLRQDLPADTALIGFCGAPWTVATYMVAGHGSSDQADTRTWAYRDPAGFQQLIDIVVEASINYLEAQVKAGADCLQIFDSWAGSLAEDEFDRWVIAPTVKIVDGLRRRGVTVPIIGFPRGAGTLTQRFIDQVKVQAVSCDTAMPLAMMHSLSANTAVQGNLDPLLLLAGGERLDARARTILETMKGRKFVFNLGHGIVQQTPPDNVTRLLRIIRG